MQEVAGAGGHRVSRQGRCKPVPALRQGTDGGLELGSEIEGHIQGLQACGGDGVGQLQGGEAGHEGGVAQQVAQAPAGGGQGFAEGAQEHQIRVAVHGQAVGGGGELGVGLIQHHQRWLGPGGGGFQQGLQRLRGEPGPRGVVGQGEPELTAAQGFEPGRQGKARALRYGAHLTPVAAHQQGIKAEGGLGHGHGVPGAEARQGHQVQQGAAGGTQEQATRGGTQPLAQALGQLRLALGVEVEGQVPQARQQGLPGGRRPVRRCLVHVQTQPRQGLRGALVGGQVSQIGAEEGHGGSG